MKYDANLIGRLLFEQETNCTKSNFEFEEIKLLYNINRSKFLDIVKEQLECSTNPYSEKKVWVDLLKQILLLCYINNVNLNDYFEIKPNTTLYS